MTDDLGELVEETGYEYITQYWWADGESETLVTYFGDKTASHEEKLESAIENAKRHLERERIESSDPQVKAQVRTYKLVTYRKDLETHWTSDQARRMKNLRKVVLNEDQLNWLLFEVDFGNFKGWRTSKVMQGVTYIDNSALKIQVSLDIKAEKYSIWTWEDGE